MMWATQYCFRCVHYIGGIELVCAAFPAGIPVKILAATIDHTGPIDGDNGLQFEPMVEVARLRAER